MLIPAPCSGVNVQRITPGQADLLLLLSPKMTSGPEHSHQQSDWSLLVLRQGRLPGRHRIWFPSPILDVPLGWATAQHGDASCDNKQPKCLVSMAAHHTTEPV